MNAFRSFTFVFELGYWNPHTQNTQNKTN